MVELEQPSRPFLAQPLMGVVQSAIYFAVATLLIVAAVFTCAGTVSIYLLRRTAAVAGGQPRAA
jgi:hypothetical protein